MKIIGVIPARYESTRFPGKPLANIMGKPMIWWVYNQVSKVESLDAVYVATDDQRIVDTCESYGFNVMMTSSEHQTGTDRLGEVANVIEADYYVNIQGDEPIIEPDVIDKVVQYCISNTDAGIVNTMTPITSSDEIKSKSCVKVVTNEKGIGVYLSRAEIPCNKNGTVEKAFKHLGLYGLRKDALTYFRETAQSTLEKIEEIEMLRFFESDYKIHFVEIKSDSVAVDHPHDIERVENRINLTGQFGGNGHD